MQTFLISFFHGVLQQDNTALSLIPKNDNSIYIDDSNTQLIFTITGLHEIIRTNKNISYKEFKKFLYSGSINEKLNDIGGKIEIHTSNGKIDNNVYKLVKTNFGNT
ncbi:hypothetical protein MNBD_GAMMA09-3729 [hydrothermal vent metagenome]|uniref:Uncharacterized protein n=1 Tax=hydrothermal vent metagenome TaxID=652676 RepID=A0A3B0Y206_9ZZZZ